MHLKIAVLEPDYEKAKTLVHEVIKAYTGLPIIVEVEKLRDMKKIQKFEVPETPALVINKKLKVCGRIPEKDEIRKLILEELNSTKN